MRIQNSLVHRFRTVILFKITIKASGTLLSLEWNSMRLGSPAHGIVTKTVPKTLPGGGGGPGGGWV